MIKYNWLSCNKNYSNKIDEELQKRFKNTFNFYINDISKIILLLRKDVYPYGYMDDSEKFNEIELAKKEEFHINLIWKKLQVHITCMDKVFVKILY